MRSIFLSVFNCDNQWWNKNFTTDGPRFTQMLRGIYHSSLQNRFYHKPLKERKLDKEVDLSICVHLWKSVVKKLNPHFVNTPTSAKAAGWLSVVVRDLSLINFTSEEANLTLCSMGLLLMFENSPEVKVFQVFPSALPSKTYFEMTPLINLFCGGQ